MNLSCEKYKIGHGNMFGGTEFNHGEHPLMIVLLKGGIGKCFCNDWWTHLLMGAGKRAKNKKGIIIGYGKTEH